jgi:ZIP family zinc transporter
MVVAVTAVAAATALATGLGAIPVWLLDHGHPLLRPALWGTAVGTMVVAAIAGLLGPALEEGDPQAVAAGVVGGVCFLALSRRLIERHGADPRRREAGQSRRSATVLGVLFVHSLPEGMAVGTAFASDRAGLSLFVAAAIALQNIPEGTSVALPMQAAGASRARQFWAAVGSSAPQPVGAVAAFVFVEEVRALLPFSLAFAGSAMLALAVVELAPEAYRPGSRRAGVLGTAVGAAAMLGLAAAVGV